MQLPGAWVEEAHWHCGCTGLHINKKTMIMFFFLFDSLRPRQQFFSYVRINLVSVQVFLGWTSYVSRTQVNAVTLEAASTLQLSFGPQPYFFFWLDADIWHWHQSPWQFIIFEGVDRGVPNPTSLPFHPTSLPLSPHFPPPLPPLPSPSYPTSLPLSDFSLPLIKFCSSSWT